MAAPSSWWPRRRNPAGPGQPASRLGVLSRVGAVSARRALAARPDLPEDVQHDLARDPDRRVRLALVENPGTGPAALLVALGDADSAVRWRVPGHPNVDAGVRRAACGSPDAMVRRMVARRVGESADLARELAELLTGDDDPEVRTLVASVVADPGVLARLVRSPDVSTRAGAAANPLLTADQRHHLVRDPHPQVRAALVQAEAVPEEDLAELARDPSPAVRFWLAASPQATREVLTVLAADATPTVGDLAWGRLDGLLGPRTGRPAAR